MTNELQSIGRTISTELQKAIDAALKADAVQVEAILSDMNNAYQMMMDGIERVRGMEIEATRMVKNAMLERERAEIEAAKMIKEALTEREKVEDEFHQRFEGTKRLLGTLRGSKLTGPKFKAIEGGGK